MNKYLDLSGLSYFWNKIKSYAVKRITSTDNAVVRFDGTDGNVQNSNIIIDDDNVITTPGDIILKNSGSGAATPKIEFRRGSNTDTYNDWHINTNSSGNLIVGLKASSSAAVAKATLTSSGITFANSLEASSIKKTGGTSSQFLKADGSVDSNTYINTSATAQTKSGNLTAAKFITSGGTSSKVVLGDGSLKLIDDAVSSSSDNLVQNKGVANYIVSRGENLVTNGFASLGTNYNFTSLTLNTIDTFVGGGSFTKTSTTNSSSQSSEYIPVDISQSYKLHYFVKNSGTTLTYDGLVCHDIDKYSIDGMHVGYQTGTLTTLRSELKDGDTVVYFNDLSAWNASLGGSNAGIIFWNYKNSGGYQYPPETYSRYTWGSLWDNSAAFDFVNNTITLKAAWNHGTFPAGTQVSQSASNGGTYVYGNIYTPTANQWTEKSYIFDPSKFRAGTAFVRLLHLINYSKVENTFYLCGISFSAVATLNDLNNSLLDYVDITSAQTISGVKTFSNGLNFNTGSSWTNSDRTIPFSADGANTTIRYTNDNSNTGLTYNPSTGAIKAGSFIKRNGTSSQFLKADGSVDSNTYSKEIEIIDLT